MSTAFRRLDAGLPERRAAGDAGVPTDGRALRGWIAALPMANVAAAATRLREGLASTNRQRVDGRQRLALLEAVRPPALQVAGALGQQLAGASFPLPPSKAAPGDLAMALQQELATGYRAALAELCAPRGAVPMLRGGAVVLAGVRALQHAGEVLAGAWRVYRVPPDGSWRALHDVFGFLLSVRLHERSCDDAGDSRDGSACAHYVRSLLLALANPYRFTPREQESLAGVAAALAPLARLRERGGGEGDIGIDLESDGGPGYLPEERATSGHGVLSLDLAPLLAQLREQLEAGGEGARTIALRQRGGSAVHADAALLRRLLQGLGARAERGALRLGGGPALETVFGMRDLHFMLAGEEPFAAFLQRTSGQAMGEVAGNWRTGASDPGGATRRQARVLDQGLGGYRLLWEPGGGDGVRTRVGELVGLALPGECCGAAREWMVGVVRWLRTDADHRVDAGVELLARRALAAGVRDPSAPARTPLRGVVLAPPARGSEADYDTVLTTTEVDAAAQVLQLTLPADSLGPPMPAHTRRIEDVRLLETTGIHQRFGLAG